MNISNVIDYGQYQNWNDAQKPGSYTSGYAQVVPGNKAIDQSDLLKQLYGLQAKEQRVYSGNKPLVICGGNVTECKDLNEAQRVAEREAHAKSTDAYILKPIKLVAPKREVVTTEL